MAETYSLILIKNRDPKLPLMYIAIQINFGLHSEVFILLGLAGTETRPLQSVHRAL